MINLPLVNEVMSKLNPLDPDATWPESGRSCGECQACCEVLSVRDIPDKPKWGKCRHQCSTGCGIYADRPPICRDFQCLWRAGIIEDGNEPENRPDQLGIVIAFDAEGTPDGIHCHECWPDASLDGRAWWVIRRLARKWLVFVHRFGTDDIDLLGDEWRALAWLEANAPLAARRVKQVLVRAS